MSEDEIQELYSAFGIDKDLLYINYGASLQNTDRFISAISVYQNVSAESNFYIKSLANISQCYGRYSAINDFVYGYLYAAKGYRLILKAKEINQNVEYENLIKEVLLEYNYGVVSAKKVELKHFTTEELSKYNIWCAKNGLLINYEQDLFKYEAITLTEFVSPVMLGKGEMTDMSQLHHENVTTDFDKILNSFKMIKSIYTHCRNKYYKTQIECSDNIDYGKMAIENFDKSILFDSKTIELISIYNDLYSLQDKIAYCLNLMIKIKNDPSKTSKRDIWLDKEIKEHVSNYDFLKPLYWCYLDYFSNETNHNTQYKYTDFNDIRNAFEHRSFYIHNIKNCDITLSPYNDDSIHLSESYVRDCTLDLIRVTREMIMYLLFFIDEFNVKQMYQKATYCTV